MEGVEGFSGATGCVKAGIAVVDLASVAPLTPLFGALINWRFGNAELPGCTLDRKASIRLEKRPPSFLITLSDLESSLRSSFGVIGPVEIGSPRGGNAVDAVLFSELIPAFFKLLADPPGDLALFDAFSF